tara:strand:+ start:553 stop:1299 length:747 start_codon:yes stop_codon:yes gene_type:complete
MGEIKELEAPEDIPYSLFDEYTMNGDCIIEYNYANDCSAEIQKLFNDTFKQEIFSQYLTKAANKENFYYGPTDAWLYEALEKYPIKDKNICIIGSANPWYEAIAVTYGVKSCTVIEYSKRESFHDKIIYKQPHEMSDEKFDACFSISSVEHDGLGRYGDPLDPNGDLKAMQRLKDFLHDDSLVYFAVPVGADKIVFNVHRVYGYKRIDKLLEGWDVVDQYGFNENSFTNNFNGIDGTPYQPVYVLRKK